MSMQGGHIMGWKFEKVLKHLGFWTKMVQDVLRYQILCVNLPSVNLLKLWLIIIEK